MAKRALSVSPVRPRATRPDPVKRGYSGPWRRYSEKFRKQYPLCIACTQHHTPVYCVDHIIPVSGPDDDLFMEHWNHEPLCRACHGIKTNEHDQRITPMRSTLVLELHEIEQKVDTNAARNRLLRRADIWSQWFDLSDYSIISLSL
jgi:5-methylcytosine-specific restriction endonuclease McrA